MVVLPNVSPTSVGKRSTANANWLQTGDNLLQDGSFEVQHEHQHRRCRC